MAFQLLGADGVTVIAGEASSKAIRMTPRPIDVLTGGSYSLGLSSGVMAAGLAANAEVFQFRWTSASLLCLIRTVTVSAVVNTTGFTAGAGLLSMHMARAWTVAGSGGTRATLAGNDSKRKTAFATSLVAANDAGIASTAALTAGTKTLDSQPISQVTISCGAAGSTMLSPFGIFAPNFSGEWPLVLAANEGFVLRVPLIAALGTWTFAVTAEWTEIPTFQ